MLLPIAKASELEARSILEKVDLSRLSEREILITGGSGMVASYFVSILLNSFKLLGEKPPRVTLLVRDLSSSNLGECTLEQSVVIEECALGEWVPLHSYDYLIHAASPASPTKYGQPEEILDANIGFLKRLKIVGAPNETLLISSGEVYGTRPPNPVPESYVAQSLAVGIRESYPAAKLAAEKMLFEMGEQGLTNPKVIRLFHTYGPGMKVDDGRSFADFIWAAARGEGISLRSMGEDVRTFLYLEDAVAGIITVLLSGDRSGVYNLGSQEKLSIFEFASHVAHEAGVES
jgi:nucleoside-diphosphate-sugar epimerase